MSCSEDADCQNRPDDHENGAQPDTSPVELHSFVLCKYDEARRRGDIDDWTDHSDIGACFDGRILTAEEYQRTEDRYIAAVDILARAAGASHFTLRNVFLHSPPPAWLGEVYEGRIVDKTSALRMLRGHMSGDTPAARFESEKMCMTMGFDFYMHVQIPERALASLDEIEDMGLFVLEGWEQDDDEDEEKLVSRHADDAFWTEVAEGLAMRSSAQQQEARTLVVERWADGNLGRRLWLVAADDLSSVAASVKRQALISAFVDPEIHATSRDEVAHAVEAVRRAQSDDDCAGVVVFPLAGDRELLTVTVGWDDPLPDDGGLPPGQEFGVFPWPAADAVCLEAVVPGGDGCVTARWVASSTS